MTQVPPPTFTVTLIDPGGFRLEVMRMVRSLRPELGLKESKALIDSAPQVVLREVDYYEIERVRRRPESAGAHVECRRNW